MARNYMKSCLTLITTHEMQTKTRYDFLSTRPEKNVNI